MAAFDQTIIQAHHLDPGHPRLPHLQIIGGRFRQINDPGPVSQMHTIVNAHDNTKTIGRPTDRNAATQRKAITGSGKRCLVKTLTAGRLAAVKLAAVVTGQPFDHVDRRRRLGNRRQGQAQAAAERRDPPDKIR